MGKKNGVFIKCDNCGKEIYRTQYQFNKAVRHYCCTKCQKEYEHNLTYEDRKCEICGNIFHTKKISTQRFCSNECQHKWQRTRVGELNPRYKRYVHHCDWCGKEVLLLECETKLFDHHFCGNECRVEWYNNVCTQTKEWSDESRKRVIKMRANNQMPLTNTKPQQIINKILQRNNIIYRTEEPFIYYSIDNYLPDYNLAIEVMGDFWHSSPIKYPSYSELRDVQLKRIPKDKAKRTFMKNMFGIHILYLWESDINNNYDLCEELIKLYILSSGLLDNYNSFNYHIDNGKLKINTDIIYPYYEKESSKLSA